MTNNTPKEGVVWHIKVENGIRYFHPSYRQLSESEVKQIPDEFWQVDPIHLTKIT